MKTMAAVIHSKNQKFACLHEKINRLIENQGILVDRDTHSDSVSMMKEYSGLAQQDQTNPFMQIFWNQQLKGASLDST